MQKKIIFFIISCFILNIFFTGPVSAQDIRTRMRNRLPIIKTLKAKGFIGENNKGFLEFRGKKENVNVVNAENADRVKVYTAIAKQQKTTSDLVGKRRALKIAEVANPGEWIQNAGGKWLKK